MSKRGKVLLLAATTGYQTRVFADAARRLGLELVLATDRCKILDDPWGDNAVSVRFDSGASAEKLFKTFGPGALDAIIAVGDRATWLGAKAAGRFGLPFHPLGAVEACRDKYLARERFRGAGLPVPEYSRVAANADPEKAAVESQYPCVLKPLGLSGSRGVIRANNEQEFLAAFRRIRSILALSEIRQQSSDRDLYIQVESYIPGREFALEGIVTNGRLQTLALFDKPDPLEGPYFEETIYVTPSRESEAAQRKIIETAQAAIGALGLRHGPVHAEMRQNREGTWMLEVAARPIGGLCAKALRFTPNVPLEELIIRHALREDVSTARRKDPASGVMMIPIPRAGVYRGVAGIEKAANVPGIFGIDITAKKGQKLIPLPEGNSYLGFIFARGDSAAEVEDSLRGAHRHLQLRVSTSLPVLARS